MLTLEKPREHGEEQIDREACWALLERVAASPHLRRATRLRELLLYVGQRSLREGSDHVPEHEIGVNVFGRPDTYDNANDSIVRTTISDLRKRIDAYFAAEGSEEPLVMEIPRGAYVPIFYSREVEAARPEAASLEPHPVSATPSRPASWFDLSYRWITGVVILALLVTCFCLWRDDRIAQQSLHPLTQQSAVSSLWSGMLESNRDTDIVMEDSSFLLVQLISKQNIALSDYINKTYLGMPSISGVDPETDSHLLLISRKALGKISDFRLGLDIKQLDPENPRLHFYNAREYTPRLLERNNIILLGTPTSNPWDQWFESSLNFAEISDPVLGLDPVINRSPRSGEKAVYASTNKATSYCAIAYLPKPDRSGDMLLIQGTTSEATEAGGEFLLSEDDLSAFEKQLHLTRLPYFEILLNVSQVLGSPITGRVEAYRLYPSLH